MASNETKPEEDAVIEKFIEDVINGQSGTPEPPETEDIVQKSIGSLGRWHIWMVILLSLVKFPLAWNSVNIVFEGAPTDFWCADNITEKCAANCTSHVFDSSVFTRTIISQWDLICEKAPLASFAQTVTMFGILCGNLLFGILSDKFGRRKPLIWAVIVQVITGMLSAFAPWYWLFLILRFLVTVATGGTMITSFVLTMELIGKKYRTAAGVLCQIPFHLGFISLPLFSYFIRDWRYLQVAISAPSILLVSYFFIAPESPRWLLTVGRMDEAIIVMEKAARYNKLETEFIRPDVVKECEKEKERRIEKGIEESRRGHTWDLFSTKNVRNKTLIMFCDWFFVGLCFYGVSQLMGQLGGNIFLNIALAGVIQVPGAFAAIWSLKKLGRRYTQIVSQVIAGLGCLCLTATPPNPAWLKTTLATISMFGLSTAFPAIYIFAGEIFPTVIRNIGVGNSSACARIGSMIAPFIVGLSVEKSWLPPLIFGILPLIGAALISFLPETLDCVLPNTVEEAETFNGRRKISESKTPNENEGRY